MIRFALYITGSGWLLLIAGFGVAYAQPDNTSVTSEYTDPPSFIYSVNRTPELPFSTARATLVISREEIRRRNARNLPEMLMEEAGVFVQQTNYGGGSPIIRGMMGKHILITVDGVRLNNGTYRFGPLQYLNTIDLNVVERIEIVYGAGSVLGSDAFGGVINIITSNSHLSAKAIKFGSTVSSRYSTADEATNFRGEVFGEDKRFRYLGGASYRNTEDVTGGDKIGKQAATGYSELAGNLSFDYFLTPEQTLSLLYLFLEQDEVPRTDRITNGQNLVFNFDPQQIQLVTLSYQDLNSSPIYDFLTLNMSLNRQQEGRREIRTSAPNTMRRLTDDQLVWGINLEMESFHWNSHRFLYGVDYFIEHIHSSRYDENLTSGVRTSKRGNFTDDASYHSISAYLQDQYSPLERLTLTLGGRYNRYLATGEENSSVGELNLKSGNNDITGALNLIYHLSSKLNLCVNTTRGFRAPNLDDLSVFDERPAGIEIPNTNISAEHLFSYEFGMKLSTDRLKGSAFYYENRLSDLLIRSGGTFNGLGYFDLNGNGLQDSTEVTVLQRQNIGKAMIRGVEINAAYMIHSVWKLFGHYTRTSGEDRLSGDPLQRIPPAYGLLGIRWRPGGAKRSWMEITSMFAAAQQTLNPADESDSRIGPDGTPGFNVFNIRGGSTLWNKLGITLALENLFDEAYKYHGSGVFRPGRQVIAGIRYNVN